jgi:hypothetical protein
MRRLQCDVNQTFGGLCDAALLVMMHRHLIAAATNFGEPRSA